MVPRTALPVLTALFLLLAGCGGSTAPLQTPTVDTSATPDPSQTRTETTAPSQGDERHFRRFEFSATSVSETDIAREVALPREEVERAFVWRERPFTDDLFANHSAERVVIEAGDTDGLPGRLENGDTLRINGTYYRLNKTVVDEHEGPALRMRLKGPLREQSHDEYDRATEEAVDYSTLSSLDRRIFTYAVPALDDRGSGTMGAGYFWVYPRDVSRERSRLVDGDEHFVRHEGDYFRIEADGRRGRAVRYRVRYELSPIATSASEFAERRLDTLVTPVDDESVDPPAREVLLETLRTTSESWEGETKTPERYREAAAWVYDHPPDGNTAFVRYDGSLYRIRLTVVME